MNLLLFRILLCIGPNEDNEFLYVHTESLDSFLSISFVLYYLFLIVWMVGWREMVR